MKDRIGPRAFPFRLRSFQPRPFLPEGRKQSRPAGNKNKGQLDLSKRKREEPRILDVRFPELPEPRCVLFHSLFKVLFSFPSQYLFAIGLGTIFRLRRSTPASLHSTLKLCDSWSPRGWQQGLANMYGALTLYGGTFQNACFASPSSPRRSEPYNSAVSDSFHCRFRAGPSAYPFHSPLLKV